MNNIILTKRGKVDTGVAIPINTRKFMRKRAKQKMEREGVPHMNRDVIFTNPITGVKENCGSYFSNHWREYGEA